MGWLDWLVVALYTAMLIGVALYTFNKQKTSQDYYLAGRKLKGRSAGLSLLANQVSAISLIGAPAFIALKKDGGLFWLQYELSVPLGMVFLIFVVKPLWAKSRTASIYDLIGVRYGESMQKLLVLIFSLSRGMATSVALLATGYVTASAFNIPLGTSLILIGVVSLIYSSLGGLEGDVISDLIQLVILWGSAVFTIIFLLKSLEGEFFIELFSSSRLDSLRFDGSTFSFLPMVLGGFFLYISYYGFDQSQVQRILAVGSDYERQKAYWLNGMLRFPLVLTYCIVGVLMIPFLEQNLFLQNLIEGESTNQLMPVFFRNFLPAGLLGLVTAGIFSAAMSSLDSAIGALSAITWSDILKPFMEKKGVVKFKGNLWGERIITTGWGVFIILMAFLMSDTEDTVLVLVNKVGSVFYGPVAAVFVGILPYKKRRSRDGIVALFSGLGVNLVLWIFFEKEVSWLWWNIAGFSVTFLFLQMCRFQNLHEDRYIIGRRAKLMIYSLIGFFIFIVSLLFILQYCF